MEKISEIKNVGTITFKAPRCESLHGSVFEAMKKLKKDQCFIVETPKRTCTARQYINRLNAALSVKPIKAPAGCKFQRRATADGNVAVCCVRK